MAFALCTRFIYLSRFHVFKYRENSYTTYFDIVGKGRAVAGLTAMRMHYGSYPCNRVHTPEIAQKHPQHPYGHHHQQHFQQLKYISTAPKNSENYQQPPSHQEHQQQQGTYIKVFDANWAMYGGEDEDTRGTVWAYIEGANKQRKNRRS